MKSIDKQLDDAWSLAVKVLAGFKCEKCSNKQNLNSHHVFGRRNKSVRWHLPNGVCLCAGCHALNRDSAHQSPLMFGEWIKSLRGERWFTLLMAKARTQGRFTDFEKKIILKELTDKCQVF